LEAQVNRLVTVTVAAALALSACALPARSSGITTEGGATTTIAVVESPHPSAARALMPFDACDDLLDWMIENALDRVGPYGLDGYGVEPWMVGELTATDGDIAPRELSIEETTTTAAASDNAGSAASFDVIGTNLQEVGVDEADLVKTDGERIVVISGSLLYIVSIDDDELTVEGSIELPFWTQDLFLDGDRVIVIAGDGYDAIPFGEVESSYGQFPTPIVTVAQIDISDLDDPELTRTLRIDGRHVSSRMVDGAVRLVISSSPTGFAWAYPEGGGLRAERDAEEENRAIIRDSAVSNWLPYYIVADLEGQDRVVDEGTLLACDRTNRPDDFSGFTTLSLVTLATGDLAVADATGVFADGNIVYSSGEATYVATSQWIDPLVVAEGVRPSDQKTMIHKFALSPNGADYQASGAVPGYMLSQWSMSEHHGYLRVASTDSPEWWDGPESESMVTVLDTDGDELRTVGSVGGLGKGERIYSVRFFGDTGYVVTFRQVDPLYVIDLSNPERPELSGELKIPGYSSYLHPIEDDALLGVGQDADDDGLVRGLQASLFDVSDPSDPARIDRFTMMGGHSEVEWDHHAFLHDPSTGITVFPYERWDGDLEKTETSPTGALVLTVTEDGIRETGIVSHDVDGANWWAPIRRSLLINGHLVTVSETGLMVSDARSLATLDWVELGS
jgi:uncharacterized secreted protein with C-terminal beta-propeller domain